MFTSRRKRSWNALVSRIAPERTVTKSCKSLNRWRNVISVYDSTYYIRDDKECVFVYMCNIVLILALVVLG